MKDDRQFPLQQGDLDWLCSAYAVINLLALRKQIETPRQADDTFKALIKALPGYKWSLSRYLAEGVDPSSDIDDLINVAGFSNLVSVEPQALYATVSRHRGPIGFLIYICEVTCDHPFSHYTLVKRARKDGGFDLFDSYGFRRINSTPSGYEIDNSGSQIEIIAAWRIDD